MRMWTVLVVPHDQGNTKTLHVYSGQVWAVIAVLAGLTFTSAFLLGRYKVARAETAQYKSVNLELLSAVSQLEPDVSLPDDERARIEARIREEFGQKDQQIEQKLSELYDLERQVREIHGVPADTASVAPASRGPVGKGGKGGGPGNAPDSMAVYAVLTGDDPISQPPTVIYGMADPPADLIIQEINIRKASLQQLVDALDSKRDAVERTPSIWPTNHPRAYISSTYGNRIDPISRDIRHHDGVDFPAPYGSAVRATAKGTVTMAHYDRWLGNLVKIDHGNGIESWYAHMSKIAVQPGDAVSRGDKIGEVGSTGRSTGAHIHYEIHVNGKRVNPGKYLGN